LKHQYGLAPLRVRPDSGEAPPFQAGQFIALGLPRDPDQPVIERVPGRTRVPMIRRPYSIASPMNSRETLEFFLVLVEGGALTPKLWPLVPGTRLWLNDKVKGDFTLDGAPQGKDLVMVSTGTGIAPYMSMLRSYGGQGRWRRFIMINGVRRVSDLGYREELEELARRDPAFLYIPCVSREPQDSGWCGACGRVQGILEPQHFERLTGVPLDARQCHVFLCGNPQMIADVSAILTERGFAKHTRRQPGNLHFERYW
jgi:ferredoxin--NADP+ reductase